MGIINWLWDNTVAPKMQESLMIASYNIETVAQSDAVAAYDDSDPAYREKLQGFMHGTMRERSRLRAELEARGYSYDGCDGEGQHMFSIEDEEDEEDEEPEPRKKFLGLF